MCQEGLLTSYLPASVSLLDFTETGAFASPSECESATIDDVNESLEVRGWLHRSGQDLLSAHLLWWWEERGPAARAWASTTSLLLWQCLALKKSTCWGGEPDGRAKKISVI